VLVGGDFVRSSRSSQVVEATGSAGLRRVARYYPPLTPGVRVRGSRKTHERQARPGVARLWTSPAIFGMFGVRLRRSQEFAMLKRACAFVVLLGACGCAAAQKNAARPPMPVACSGGNSSTAPTPTQANNITLTLSPTPAALTVCSPTPCRSINGGLLYWRVQGAMTIQETAGVGVNIASITETSFNPPFRSMALTSADVTRRSGTNRVAACGMLVVPVDLLYGLVDNPGASRQHVFVFVVQFTDDRGNQRTGNAQWVAN
jgi:hypothetical protein